MAKISAAQWDLIQDDYEIKGMAYSAIMARHKVSKGMLSKKVKQCGWVKAKSEPLIQRKVSAAKELKAISEQSEQQFSGKVHLLDVEAEERLRREGYFDNSIEECQEILNDSLKTKDKDTMMLANIHSQATCRNRDAMLGKTPQTQVNIQNNVGSDADTIVERLMKKHQ